jgi:glycosyltransferase involved in cell wall biosynthesis
MKIAFFVYEYPPRLVGGLGTYAENITRKFIELGHDVTVFTLNPGDLKTKEIIKGVEVHRPQLANVSDIFPIFVTEDLRKWGTNIKFFSDIFLYNVLSGTKFINEILKKEGIQYDIACVHDWLSVISGLMIKNETKIPVVFHAHSTEWGRSGGGGSEVISGLEYKMAEKADRIITVSDAMREDLIRHGWQSSKIDVVWNGVDPKRYDPARVSQEEVKRIREEHKISDDGQMILFLGRLTWVKGVRNLVQAMPSILKDYPKAKLVILGKGEEQGDILQMATRLDIGKNVECRFDFVSEEERIAYYAASNVCVFPSVYEPFGIVSLEAMSMEKPVVVGARGVSGFREQVINSGEDQNGLHVNGSDPQDIAWGIKEVLRDPERAKKWGKNGRKRVLQYFTWEKAAEQTLQLYQGILDMGR